MNRRPVAILLFAAVLALVPVKAAAAAGWLARVGPALRGLDYEGTLVVVADGEMETLRVHHAVIDGREYERLVSLTGATREVIREGNVVMLVGSNSPPVAYDLDQAGRWSVALAASQVAGDVGYRGSLAGEARIAGYPAQQVDLLATDGWRYGYRLWLERETALPLRVDLLDARGRPIEQVAFTELALGRRPDAQDLEAPPGSSPQRYGQLPEPGALAVRWQVPAPPPGFVLRSALPMPAGGAHLLYSDGLASVSVYVEIGSPGTRGGVRSRRGAVHSRSLWFNGWHVMAIGKVPAATVDYFARTVRPVPDGG